MVVNVVMPKFGLTMEEGTVVNWLKSEGDEVTKGEPLFEVTTDKITNEVEAPASGILQKILVDVGEIAKVAEVIAVIADENESIETSLTTEQDEGEQQKKIKASPLAKKLAQEAGLDLGVIPGTGPGGRITKDDVTNYLNTEKDDRSPHKVDSRQGEPLRGIRQVIAQRMGASWREAPHVTLSREVDVSLLQDFKDKIKETDKKVSYTEILTVLAARVLKKFPDFNASLINEKLIKHSQINIGIAVALEGGLIVPVIKDADKKGILEVKKQIKDLANRARVDCLENDEISGGTFTITNLGMYGIDVFTPIINPPESAILGVGRINDRPFLQGDKLVNKPMLWLSLSFDHRVADGALAARFLGELANLVENPTLTLL